MIKDEFKLRIVEAVKENRKLFTTNATQAVMLGVKPAQLSRILKADINSVLSEQKWTTIARKLNVPANPEIKWITVKTPTFNFIYSQLAFCKEYAVSGMLCDVPDIGKTYTAKYFCKEHKNAIYIDCSQVKSKQRLIREIAKNFGVPTGRKYSEIYAELVYFIQIRGQPIIILDEFADLEYNAFLEVKALWNATEGCCSFYIMGADGLKKKLDHNKDRQKVGYAEIFSRLGNKYQRITEEGTLEIEEFRKLQFAQIAKAQGLNQIHQRSLKTGASLRKLHTEVKKELNKNRMETTENTNKCQD